MDEDDEKSTDTVLKIVICGDGTSGKTSLCLRLTQSTFSIHYAQTVGFEFYTKRLLLPDKTSVLLQVWDIGGQSIASPMLQKYIIGANGAIVVYDVTNSSSFESLNEWLSVIEKAASLSNQKIHFSLVGNKTDMEQRRTVHIEQHIKFAEQYKMSSHYVSAKTGDGVMLMFRQIAADILGKKLTKTDIEADIAVIEAPLAVPDEAQRLQHVRDQSKYTSVCSVM
uniref:Ras-related protein Rab-28 n=1 Tax=Syphacia muris TaxID=451379 RepID=A0A0N5A9R4_9BILA